MWLPGQRQQAWDDIQQLFSAQQLPPVTAAHFLVSAAERLGGKGLLTVREQGPVIKVTHQTCTVIMRRTEHSCQSCLLRSSVPGRAGLQAF